MPRGGSTRSDRGPNPKEGGAAAYPELCQKCAATKTETVHCQCDFCRDFAFQERILCDLTRSVQDRDRFECYAFRPMSRPFPVKGTNDTPDVRKPNLLLSLDSYKYQHALAVQKVRRDPDGVYVHLVYHLVWNMANRKPLLTHRPDTRGLIEDGFSACGEEIGGFARVLWLASDHIHVYVESDGEKSVDAVVKVLRRVSARTLRDFLARGARWEGAYFAQTVG